jgi:hypothetical protein
MTKGFSLAMLVQELANAIDGFLDMLEHLKLCSRNSNKHISSHDLKDLVIRHRNTAVTITNE